MEITKENKTEVMQKLAKDHNVSTCNVRAIWYKERWAHATQPFHQRSPSRHARHKSFAFETHASYVAEEDETPRIIAQRFGPGGQSLVLLNKLAYPTLTSNARILRGTKLCLPPHSDDGRVANAPKRQVSL